MLKKFFIFSCLVFVCGSYAAPVSLPWSHEASFYVSSTAFQVLRDNVSKEAKEEMGGRAFPNVYAVQENFLPGCETDNAFLEKNRTRHFVLFQKTLEARKKFFEDRMEIFTIPDNDPRVDLRGKLGVRAKIPVKPLSFLGVLSGILRYTKNREFLYPDLQSWIFSKNREKLEKAMSTEASSPKDLICFAEDEIDKNQGQMVGCQSIGDWRGYHFTRCVTQGNMGPLNLINRSSSKINVCAVWLKFKDNLCPIPAVFSTEDIKPGEEMLLRKPEMTEEGLEISKMSPEERKVQYKLDLESIIETYTKANQIAREFGSKGQIQILPAKQDREIIDVFSLFKEKKKR